MVPIGELFHKGEKTGLHHPPLPPRKIFVFKKNCNIAIRCIKKNTAQLKGFPLMSTPKGHTIAAVYDHQYGSWCDQKEILSQIFRY